MRESWKETGALCIGLGRAGKSSSAGAVQRCQMVGMEDGRHPGKLRKYQCCPVKSSKRKSKLAKGIAFFSGEPDDEDDNFAQDDDFVDDDDDDNDDDRSKDDNRDDDDPHDTPPTPPSPVPAPSQEPSSPAKEHAPTIQPHFEFVSDDDFVSDAGI